MSALRQYNEAAAILAAEIAEQDAEILSEDATWDREPDEFSCPAMFDGEAEYASRFGGR